MKSLVIDQDQIQPMKVPIINISSLSQDSDEKSLAIKELHDACKNKGIFHVINHGISQEIMEEALEVTQRFFDLPAEKKNEVLEVGSPDIFSPASLATFRQSAQGSDLLQRDLLRLFANPFEQYVKLWPKYPVDYREKMGRFAIEMRKLAIQLFGAMMESLNLSASNATHLEQNFEKGLQMIVSNSYSPSQDSSIKIGTPPHSDFSIMTILLPSCSGLQVMDSLDGTWKLVPELKGSLQVFVGDHLEILSNGIYKSVMHFVPNTTKNRLSLGSFHNFEMDQKVEPENITLVDEEEYVKKYKECSVRDFLNLVLNGASERPIEDLKI